jgi:eukaryotic-like serine/threonine-protein kinase
MAVFGSLLFNRTIKQFLACKDLHSKNGMELIEKIKAQAKEQLEKILEVIPDADSPHGEILIQICQGILSQGTEDLFLENLSSETTTIRVASKNVLSESQQINPAKLFKKMHESDGSETEIIDILEFQKKNIAPELIVKNALRLDKANAGRLFTMAQSQAERTDMSALSIDIESLDNPDIKIMLIRFLAAVNQPESARMLIELLADKSKIVVIDALKNLKNMSTEYDPSPIVRFIPDMREEDQKAAFEILRLKSSEQTLPSLTMLMTGKSDELREQACNLVVEYASSESLEKVLIALDVHEWWGKEQAVKWLLTHGNNSLYRAAASLTSHENDFVKNSAQQLAANSTTQSGEITELIEPMMSENWQVREQAIEAAGKMDNRKVLEYLSKVLKKYPESSIAVLKATSSLGFSKGLEIASQCMRMKEAAIQREALRTIDDIVNQRHANNVRAGIVKMVPKLQATVRDTALEVINSITEKFNLPRLDLDEESMFETRLIKIEENRDKSQHANPVAVEVVEQDKTEVVSFQHIEELKEGDIWMDRYKIIREVGRGAMGRVMLVEDETVGETMILKFMHPELTSDGQARERFLRELKYSRKISHPNVIRIHDFLVKDGISAISMEFFESIGLDYMIKHEMLKSEQQSLEILYQVCDGMYEAHQKHVIHRDLKPSNILINDAGLAKVVDFGIASATTETDATLTKTGMIIGTPAYLSPERAKGLVADHRSDIYALGIIAYTMFSGRPPYKGEPMSLLFQHIEGKAVPLFRLDIGIRAGVSMLVQKMMAADIDKRYQTMKDVRDTIKQLM